MRATCITAHGRRLRRFGLGTVSGDRKGCRLSGRWARCDVPTLPAASAPCQKVDCGQPPQPHDERPRLQGLCRPRALAKADWVF